MILIDLLMQFQINGTDVTRFLVLLLVTDVGLMITHYLNLLPARESGFEKGVDVIMHC